MRAAISATFQQLIELQRGVISRRQALDCGLTPDAIDWLIRSKRWQHLRRGVYSVFTGEPSREGAMGCAAGCGI
jgi:hypothetical protein